jgi:hypothetical protein
LLQDLAEGLLAAVENDEDGLAEVDLLEDLERARGCDELE